MNTDNIASKSISLIVARHRGEKSLRDFAADLSSKLPESISHQTIKNWEDGNNKPAYHLMLAIALHNDDWRRQMALEILEVLKPSYYTPDQLKIIS
jgi:hypothetical protein